MTINIEDLGNMDFSDIATGEFIPSVRPGLFLRELLDEFGLSQTRLAVAIGVSAMRISHIIKGSRPITAEIALRLGLFFGQSPQYWLNLQTRYDMECATSRLFEKLRHEIAPFPQAA